MKIMVLPGTIWQIPLIKKIKYMGHKVYLVNPTRNDEIISLADEYLQADIFDYDRIIFYCKENGIDVVISDECDIATEVVSRINAAIGANCITGEMAELFSNKFRMREFCAQNDIHSIPAYRLCSTVEEAIDFYTDYGPKIILKPVDSNASHGVFTITKIEDLKKLFEESLRFSRRERTVLVESFIEGPEFTVDGIMTGQGHTTLAISKKEHYKHNENIACALMFEQSNAEYDYDLLRKTNDELLNKTGLPFGLTHVEYKYCDGKYYLIEMAARGGGNLISAQIVPFLSGIDNYKYLINKSLDNAYSDEIILKSMDNRVAELRFFDFPNSDGVVQAIYGEDYLKEESRITSYKLNFGVGDIIARPENDSVRLGYYIICAESKEELEQIEAQIKQRVRIDVE